MTAPSARDERGIRAVDAHESHTRPAGWGEQRVWDDSAPPDPHRDECGIRSVDAHESHIRAAGPSRNGRVLVAGIGNVFLGDDGFGVEVAQRLAARGGLPAGVEVADVGIRGVHLAYRLLDGYAGLLLVDAIHRDGPPGTLYRLEHTWDGPPRQSGVRVDGHDMSPDVVLGLLRELAAATDVDTPVGRVVVLGCEPADVGDGIGLSPPVAAAADRAPAVVDELLDLLLDTREGAHP